MSRAVWCDAPFLVSIKLRTVSLSRFTSVLAMVFCLVVGVGFVFGLCFLALVVLVLLCLGFRLCTICSVIHKL